MILRESEPEAKSEPNQPEPEAKPEPNQPVVAETTIVKSEAYLAEEAHYARDDRGNIFYKGDLICRFYCTSRGCKNGILCRFLHIKLGCVFAQQAVQGCCFEDGKECPFSHDPDAVVVAKKLFACSNQGCDRSCMHENSTCLCCFNNSSRNRRAHLRQVRERAVNGFSNEAQRMPVYSYSTAHLRSVWNPAQNGVTIPNPGMQSAPWSPYRT